MDTPKTQEERRTRYLCNKLRAHEHYVKYAAYADAAKRAHWDLRAMVREACRSPSIEKAAEYIRKCLKADEHLNNIPIEQWDNAGRALLRFRGPDNWPWAPADVVCTLKHVARHVVAGIPAPEPLTPDEQAEWDRAH